MLLWLFSFTVTLSIVLPVLLPILRQARRRPEPRQRPDYARIALLEWELLGIEPEPATFAAAALALKAGFATVNETRARDQRRAGRGGYMSSDRTINDLGPFPASWMQRPGCSHSGGEWAWSERGGRTWCCPSCPKPVPPPGPGAGSPTGR